MPALRLLLAFGLLVANLSMQAGAAYAWPFTDSSPQCNARWVDRLIKFHFAEKFRHYNEAGLRLQQIVNPALTYERQRDKYHEVGRQFCHATVALSDGSRRDMWYLIADPWGFAGVPGTHSLDFCVVGLDPNHFYGKDCSTIRDTLGW